jgi:hypothetical protein
MRRGPLVSDQVRDDPRAQARQLYADNQRAFARKVDDLLLAIRVFSESLGHAIGDIGHDEAWTALRREVLVKFDEHLPLTPVADPQLLLLVRDAYRLLSPEGMDDLGWSDDLKDWRQEAERYVTSDDPRRS